MLEGIEAKNSAKCRWRLHAWMWAEIKEYEDRTERQIKILSDIYEEKIAKFARAMNLLPA